MNYFDNDKKLYMLLLSGSEKKELYGYKYNLLEKHNQNMRAELFSCLGLEEDANFDDFAEKFGGLSKAEILKRITT